MWRSRTEREDIPFPTRIFRTENERRNILLFFLIHLRWRNPGFPSESPGKIALAVKAKNLRRAGDGFPAPEKLYGGLDFQLEQVFVDADSGIFVEDALQTRLADAAEAGDFGNGGLAVDIAVEEIYGPAEKNGVRIAGGRGNGSGFGKGEHEKLQVRSCSLGKSG